MTTTPIPVTPWAKSVRAERSSVHLGTLGPHDDKRRKRLQPKTLRQGQTWVTDMTQGSCAEDCQRCVAQYARYREAVSAT